MQATVRLTLSQSCMRACACVCARACVRVRVLSKRVYMLEQGARDRTGDGPCWGRNAVGGDLGALLQVVLETAVADSNREGTHSDLPVEVAYLDAPSATFGAVYEAAAPAVVLPREEVERSVAWCGRGDGWSAGSTTIMAGGNVTTAARGRPGLV